MLEFSLLFASVSFMRIAIHMINGWKLGLGEQSSTGVASSVPSVRSLPFLFRFVVCHPHPRVFQLISFSPPFPSHFADNFPDPALLSGRCTFLHRLLALHILLQGECFLPKKVLIWISVRILVYFLGPKAPMPSDFQKG